MSKEHVDVVVEDIARNMLRSAIAGKWDSVLEELAPYVEFGKLSHVEKILKKYWPPEEEVEEQLAAIADVAGGE